MDSTPMVRSSTSAAKVPLLSVDHYCLQLSRSRVKGTGAVQGISNENLRSRDVLDHEADRVRSRPNGSSATRKAPTLTLTLRGRALWQSRVRNDTDPLTRIAKRSAIY